MCLKIRNYTNFRVHCYRYIIVRYDYCGTIENVRLKGCELVSGGSMGLIVGYAYYGALINCSATDSSMSDSGSTLPLYAGGLVGSSYYARVEGCYTRDVSISITNSLAVNGVGGLAGCSYASIVNCYTHGSIEAEGSYVGGITGKGYSGVDKCWSYVDILQTSGNYAAGRCGQEYTCRNAIALGNVSGAGADTQRLIATFYSSSSNVKGYAYSGQSCGKLGTDEPGADYVTLLSGEELGRTSTWQDVIRLNDGWDYTPVSRGCTPLLLSDCENEEWQQQDIPLPGQADDPTLRLLDALYDENGTYSFQLTAQLEHPGLKSDEIIALYKAGKLTVTLNGMDLSDAATAEGRALLELSEAADSEATLISIRTNGFTKALDSYRHSITYTEPSGRTRNLDAMVEYKTSLGEVYHVWWEVSNQDEWNALMPEHGSTGENVRITGTVDFNNKGTSFDKLSFNRLVGAEGSCGFANLLYDGGADGVPWIEKVGMELKDLSFIGMSFDFSGTKTAVRTMTGAILSVGEVSNLTLKNIELTANSYTRGYFSFLSNVSGVIDSVVMEGVTLRDTTPGAGGNYSYSGALAAVSSSEVHKVTASNVNVDMPKDSYVGGILGRQLVAYNEFYENTIENFTVTGRNSVGGLGGYICANYSHESRAEHGTVSGTDQVGGLFGWFCAYMYMAADHYDWFVGDVTVNASAGLAGGACGMTRHLIPACAVVEDCTISDTTFVGGLAGDCNGMIRFANDLRITGCTIRNTGTGTVSGDAMGTGGMLGRFTNETYSLSFNGIVVRDCTIEGPGYVGGLIGASSRKAANAVFQRILVAEDVTVTATGSGPAGGIYGSAIRVDLRDSACGATVTAKTAAGGIIGQLEPQSNEITAALTNVYYKGSVTATTDYAGGVVGKLNTGSVKLTDSNMKNVLVAADVRSSGEHTSLWVNMDIRNNTSGSTGAGTGLIYICEDSLLNGQTSKAIIATAAAEGKTVYVAPQRPAGDKTELLVSAEDFAKESFYSSRGFASSAWDYTDLSTFMPYPKNADGSGVAEYARLYKYEDADVAESVGILLPTGGTIGTELKVYASGADTVNIETGVVNNSSGSAALGNSLLSSESDRSVDDGTATNLAVSSGTSSEGGGTLGYASENDTESSISLPSDIASTVEVTVNGKKYTTDENGVITLVYDFTSDLKVNEVTYSADTLTRKVMTYGKYWYYIDTNGAIHYGLAVKSGAGDTYEELGTVDIQDKAVHLWQGYALTESGELVALNGGETGETSGSGEAFTQVPSKPYLQNGSTQVYYNFTLYKNQSIPYRVFLMDGTAYTVSPVQEAVYDGVVLSSKTEYGATSRYFALLGEDGGALTAYLSSMKLGNITNGGISHISNSFGYTGTVMLAYYDSGDVVGVDYTTGEEVCSTLPAITSFMTYAIRTVMNLAQNGGANMAVSDGSFYDGENIRTELDGDGQYSSSGTAAISDSGSGENGFAVANGTGNAASDTGNNNGSNTGRTDSNAAYNGTANIVNGIIGSAVDNNAANTVSNAADTSAASESSDALENSLSSNSLLGSNSAAAISIGMTNESSYIADGSVDIILESANLAANAASLNDEAYGVYGAAYNSTNSVGEMGSSNASQQNANASSENDTAAASLNDSAANVGTENTSNSTEVSGSASYKDGSTTAAASNTAVASDTAAASTNLAASSGAANESFETGSNTNSGSEASVNNSFPTGTANSDNAAGHTGTAGGRKTSGGSTTTAGSSAAISGNAAATSVNAGNSQGSAANAIDTANENSDSELKPRVLGAYQELFGDSLLAYSEKTGKYELLDTEKLSEGEEVKRTDTLAEKSDNKNNGSDNSSSDEKEDEEQDPDGDEDSFSVAWGINRSLDSTERQGFLLIALASGIGIAVLAILYFKVIRRRKK